MLLGFGNCSVFLVTEQPDRKGLKNGVAESKGDTATPGLFTAPRFNFVAHEAKSRPEEL